MRLNVAQTAAIAALFAIAPTTTTAQLSKTGNLTLFSDTACASPVFANSWTVGRSFCAKVDGGSAPAGDVFTSYVVNERPWCESGARPWLNVYRDEACGELIQAYPPGPLYHPTGPDADGTCVAPGGSFRAIVFVCDDDEEWLGDIQGAATMVDGSSSSTDAASLTTQTMSVTTSTLFESTPLATSAAVSGDGAAATSIMSKVSTALSVANATVTGAATSTGGALDPTSTPAFTGGASSLQMMFGPVVAMVLLPLA